MGETAYVSQDYKFLETSITVILVTAATDCNCHVSYVQYKLSPVWFEKIASLMQ